MASYDAEKFERQADGLEQIVYWQQNKHFHNAAFITTVEIALGKSKGGTWSVRANSYQPRLSSPPTKAVDFADL